MNRYDSSELLNTKLVCTCVLLGIFAFSIPLAICTIQTTQIEADAAVECTRMITEAAKVVFK